MIYTAIYHVNILYIKNYIEIYHKYKFLLLYNVQFGQLNVQFSQLNVQFSQLNVQFSQLNYNYIFK
jgi:hypothetical protein